ncbi:meiosis-specific protein MEI4-like isoform X2 [Haliotis rufescens]|uniref:meiosis-specific protein MEI4-like isoform X2 n=1 Tax=Haliotis rufescens TaxID=6454 RepID=UPI00201E8A64|nr:meiosis-specific protein MEI4-like isoform X2 [Haliotis rufescens]
MTARSCIQRVKCRSTESEDLSLLKQIKLAVALAVIRSRPPSRTAKEQTEYLSSLFMTSQHKWQERWANAQEEILNLKQQLLMSHSGSLSSEITGEESMFDSQSIFPTPPSSSEASDRDPSVLVQRGTLGTDMAFLKSIINLDRSGAREEKVTHYSHDCDLTVSRSDVTWDTVDHSLRCVGEMLCDPARLLTTSFLPQALTSVVSVLEQESADGKLQHCRRTLLNVLSSIIQRALATDRIRQSGEISRLLQLLPCFYQTKSLALLQEVLYMFCHHIEQFACHLRQAHCAKVDFCPILAENMYDIIVVMETCVHNSMLQTTRAGHIVCGQVQERLERCLLHLTRKYPLLAHAIWRVTNSLELCVTKTSYGLV